MTEGPQDARNKRIAFLVSMGLHAGLFLTFFFLVSWRAPYPPAPEYGVVLNFGLDAEGGGDVQPDKPVGNADVDDQPSTQPAAEKNQESPPNQEAAVKSETKEEKTEEGIVSDTDSPVTVKSDQKKTTEKAPQKTEAVKDTKVAEPVKPALKKEALYTGGTGNKKGESNQSQGDDPGKVGDKGSPEGKLDANALYGKPGGGGGGDGFGLSMSGWNWASKPRTPDLPDNENGRIVFEIECDENGEIVGITTLERGLSPKAEQLLKDEIRKNALIRTTNGKVPEKSKGKVVFVLKTK